MTRTTLTILATAMAAALLAQPALAERKHHRHDGRNYAVSSGCPPGLARKHNGCQPPGQARKNWSHDGHREGDRHYTRRDGHRYDEHRYDGHRHDGHRYDGRRYYGDYRDGHRYDGYADGWSRHVHVGDRIDRRFIVVQDPWNYGLDPRHTYYRADNRIFRVDRQTLQVIAILGLVNSLLP